VFHLHQTLLPLLVLALVQTCGKGLLLPLLLLLLLVVGWVQRGLLQTPPGPPRHHRSTAHPVAARR
jgi:hypothetical protein